MPLDKAISEYIRAEFPKFNEEICNGLASSHLKPSTVEEHVDGIFRSAATRFPPEVTYEGYSRCTPKEELEVITSKKSTNSKRFYEISISDVFLVKYRFNNEGRELRPLYLYLPFVRDGGLIRLRGKLFAISPVIADQTLTVSNNSMFAYIRKARLIFNRLIHQFKLDGERKIAYVIWSKIYNTALRDETALAHYLFCKYGVRETFHRMAGSEVAVGTSEINTDRFPPDEWHICESMGKPRGFRGSYTPSPFKIAIKKSSLTLATESLIGAFFYVTDYYTNAIHPEDIDDTTIWKVLLGYKILDPMGNEGKLLLSIEAHLDSLDSYLDIVDIEEMKKAGIFVSDIYKFFEYIITNMPYKVATTGPNISSLYGKMLTVRRYVLKGINNEIFNMHYGLRKKYVNAGRPLSDREVMTIFKNNIHYDAIFRISQLNGEVTSVGCPGDNKYIKITCDLVPQVKTQKVIGGSKKGKKRSGSSDPTQFLHASQAEVASFAFMPKSDPTGRSKINPYLRIGQDGEVLRNPEFAEILNKIDDDISR